MQSTNMVALDCCDLQEKMVSSSCSSKRSIHYVYFRCDNITSRRTLIK
uniref:Uncharacterized protein n=1 Tax=Anopheles atroparvus TaxID=41427 RepID=A0AAG5DRX1_ANOAO